MRKNAYIIPILAVLLGAVGFFLRKKELNTIFDSATGLAEKSASVSVLIFVLTVVVVIFACIFTFAGLNKFTSKDSYERSFKIGSLVKFWVYIIACIVMAVGGVLYYKQFGLAYARTNQTETILFTAIAVIAAVCQGILARGAYKGKGKGLSVPSIIAPVFFCYWLIIAYKANATNPVLLDYCYECLAIIAAILSFHFAAGFVYGKPRIKQTVLFSVIGIFLCVMSLADMEVSSLFMVMAAAAGMMILNLHSALISLKKK